VELERKIAELSGLAADSADLKAEIDRLEGKAQTLRRKIFGNLTPWQRVQLARHPARPRPHELVGRVIADFVELRGDRVSRDDPGVLAGLGYLQRRAVAVLAHGRGRLAPGGRRWTGPPDAGGLRKALRVVDLAQRFELPVITFVDVADDERRSGLRAARTAEPLAALLAALTELETPGVSVITGEAYGAAAMGLLALDRVLMMEHAVCAPLPPERCAIREHGGVERTERMAANLRLTAEDIKAVGLCDVVLDEPAGGAHRRPEEAADTLAAALRRQLTALDSVEIKDRVEARRDRLETLGQLVALRK
jgi:acetyl-CoA carboxylase carboxyl transferase subunit alpha